VVGNSDEMLATPSTFENFTRELPGLNNLWATNREMTAFEREVVGYERLEWLRN